MMVNPVGGVDLTFRLAEEFGITHPHLFVDVEPYIRERLCDLREDLSVERNELWRQDATGEGSAPLGLPSSAVPVSVRGAEVGPDGQREPLRVSLKRCQLADAALGPIFRAVFLPTQILNYFIRRSNEIRIK